ncbi:MAG TPA: serine hydrolase domain-containing protein, partial [Cyclobacteriaceae bacterium]|nr:serine hydrolase domain-containing protein [Cyclobacteriaceae bacterium]
MNLKFLLILFVLLNVAEAGHCQPRKQRKIQTIIDNATETLPGIAVYINDPKAGEWIGVSGFADVENKILLQQDHIFSLGSIGKMYAAVAALKLAEEGRLGLDDKISLYLPEEIISNLANGQIITVRHLMGNTSGLYNYESDPQLNELYITGKLKLDTVSHLDMLKRYVFAKSAMSKPGEAYHYSSTNFMLLAMIMDTLIPQGHSDYLQQLVSNHGFTKTYYRQTPPAKLINHYGDLNRDGQIENLTKQTIETTNWFMGD